MSERNKNIFRNASTTYFYSSLFFPKKVREDVFTLYAFVRTADDFVDATPQNRKGFEKFVTNYKKALSTKKTGSPIIDDFVLLSMRKKFDPKWTEDFLQAMRTDLSKKTYRSIGDTATYMYGSAEVIGLFMAAILGLPKQSYPAAQKLGRAFQYVNFLRDIPEDTALGRTYIPQDVLQKYGLKNLREESSQKQPKQFAALMDAELRRYLSWQRQAEKGFTYIPWRYRVAIQTASDMYAWTAKQIMNDPFIVYKRKVKPPKSLIIAHGIKNMVFS